MQNNKKVVESFLDVLKEKILLGEDCGEILSQVGSICKPKYTVCKILPLKNRFEFVNKEA